MPLLCSIYLRIFDHVPSMCKLWSLWHTLAHIVSDGLTLLSISLTYYTHALSLSLSSYISSHIIFYLSHFHLGSSSYSLSLSLSSHMLLLSLIYLLFSTLKLSHKHPLHHLSLSLFKQSTISSPCLCLCYYVICLNFEHGFFKLHFNYLRLRSQMFV